MRGYFSKKLKARSAFAKDSFRTVKLGANKRLIIGCPKGKWDKKKKRCSVGTKSYELLYPRYRNPKMQRKSKYNVTNAPRHIRMKWLKKAQAARKYYSRCRKRLGSRVTPRLSAPTPIQVPTPKPIAARPLARSIYESDDLGWNPQLRLLKKDSAGDYRVRIMEGKKLAVPGEDGYYTPDFDDAWATSQHILDTRPDVTDERAEWARVKAAQRFRKKHPKDWGDLREEDELNDMFSNPGFSIQPGNRVSFVDRFNKVRTGRAVMRSSSGGWVLNMGGRYGTPAVVFDDQITKVSGGSGGRRARARNPELLVVSNPDRRIASMRRRRRRKYNSWRGDKAGHARAARKGWRRRRARRHNSRRRKGSRRSHRRSYRRRGGRRTHFRTWKAAVRALGVKKAAKAWRKQKRSRRRK